MDVAPEGIARRLYDASVRAAEDPRSRGTLGDVLMRFGVAGLMVRHGFPVVLSGEQEARVRLHKLAQSFTLDARQEIADALSANKVHYFLAKGGALLGQVYRPGDRMLADLDVYVPEDDRDAVLRLLVDIGFSPLDETSQAGPPELRSALTLIRDQATPVEALTIDLHWTLDPVERLLPRRTRPVPARIWDAVEERDGIMAPSPEHHAALLAHHLVHTDLLHVRSLLDIAYVFAELPPHAGTEYQLVCRELRLGRFAVILAQIMSRDFGIERPRAIGDGPGRLNALTRRLDLESWLTLVAATDPGADNVITTERIRRRTRLVDAGNTATLWEDVFFPPACFLKWRWNTNTLWVARLHHYRQLARKSMPILQSPARD